MKKQVNRGHGFSLIQIMVSIALFVLLISLVVANTRFLNKFLIRVQIDKLYNTFRYLQRCAISTGKKQVLEFDLVKQQYTYGERTCKLPTQIVFDVVRLVKGPPACPTRVIKSPITFKNNNVTFKANGIIEPGTVYITDIHKKNMYAISSSVAQVSYLRKYVYNGKWVSIS